MLEILSSSIWPGQHTVSLSSCATFVIVEIDAVMLEGDPCVEIVCETPFLYMAPALVAVLKVRVINTQVLNG